MFALCRLSGLVLFAALITSGCDSRTDATNPSERSDIKTHPFAGTWRSVEFRGDSRLNTDNFEMQLVVDRSGQVSGIGVYRSQGRTDTIRSTAHIEGDFLVNEDGDISKLQLVNERLEILDIKNNMTFVFSRNNP